MDVAHSLDAIPDGQLITRVSAGTSLRVHSGTIQEFVFAVYTSVSERFHLLRLRSLHFYRSPDSTVCVFIVLVVHKREAKIRVVSMIIASDENLPIFTQRFRPDGRSEW